jgi:hypothetical protein
MKISKALLPALVILMTASCAHAVDLKQIEHELNTTGAVGWVHGASPSQGLYVFTYRNPKDFFDFVEMSLVAPKTEILKQLEALGRHDQVRIKGTFMDNPSPQKHIEVTSVEMVKKFVSPYPVPAYEHEAKVPDELLDKTTARFLVHAVHSDGHILVVEYKDTVLPIWVRNGDLTKNLFRGDVVQLTFSIQANPNQPVHLKINEAAPGAVQLVDSIKARNGKPVTVEGTLVFFPKSPEISFNVFAVLDQLPDGLTRQYTLVNFDSPDAFTAIRKKLQDAWDKYPGAYTNGRNKLVSTRIRVRATGIFNEVDPNQANAQILLKSADAIEVLEQR